MRETHILHDDIESGYSISSYKQECFWVIRDFVNIANFASSE